MELFERTVLENGLTLEIWDESRKIAADTVKVALTAKIEVGVKEEYLPGRDAYETVTRHFGDKVLFEYRKERTFVDAHEKDAVFKKLLEEFKEATLKYIARPNFAAGFVTSKFMDIQRNPFKYRGGSGKPNLTVIN